MLRLVLVIDLQLVQETGLQSRFFCLAQNLFQSNFKLTTPSVIYLYHKQESGSVFISFGYVANVFPQLSSRKTINFELNIHFRGSVYLSDGLYSVYTGCKAKSFSRQDSKTDPRRTYKGTVKALILMLNND